jgi:hypothetical protein
VPLGFTNLEPQVASDGTEFLMVTDSRAYRITTGGQILLSGRHSVGGKHWGA